MDSKTIRRETVETFKKKLVESGVDPGVRAASIADIIQWRQSLPAYESGYIHGRIVATILGLAQDEQK